ncbi:MAG: DNA topoisomerase [Candidatus Woesearchaeota archaeon]|jgi:DNA topoisomerase-1
MSELKTIKSFPPLIATQKFTKPPSRYSDVSLCGELDKLTILRPSMANGQITKLLKDRNYISMNKGTITVTDLGINVVEFLINSKFDFIDTKFTAKLEEELDHIASGNKTKSELLHKFYDSLLNGLENAKNLKQDNEKTEFMCPLCKQPLLLKHSYYGKFFTCSGRKSKTEGCQYKATYGEGGNPIEKKKAEHIVAPFKCPKCKSDVFQRTSTYGNFWSCSKFPSCKTICDDNGVEKIKTKKKWYKKK